MLLRWSLTLGVIASLAAGLIGCGSVAAPAESPQTESRTWLGPTAITSTATFPREGEQPAVVSVAGLQPTKTLVLDKPNPQPTPLANRPVPVSSREPLATPALGPTPMVIPESPETLPSETRGDSRPHTGYVLTTDQDDDTAHVPRAGSSSSETHPAAISSTSGAAAVQGQSDPVEGQPYTWEDGDRTLKALLQSDLTVGEDGEIAPREESEDTVVTRGSKGDVDRKGISSGDSAVQPVFRSESGELMTLPGGVLLALDPEWTRAETDALFAGNGIELNRVSDLGFVDNGFFVETEPGFPSLNLANTLAGQDGVILSSPNWWTEVSPE